MQYALTLDFKIWSGGLYFVLSWIQCYIHYDELDCRNRFVYLAKPKAAHLCMSAQRQIATILPMFKPKIMPDLPSPVALYHYFLCIK